MVAAIEEGLLPGLTGAHVALRVGPHELRGAELRAAVATVATQVLDHGAQRVLVPTHLDLASALAVLGTLAAGAVAVPVDGRSGDQELSHIVADADPGLVLAPAGSVPCRALTGRDRLVVDPAALSHDADRAPRLPAEPDPALPALVIYTSGTTGPPKGAVLSRRALAANLDALATVWTQSPEDRLVHSLPLFHVHGLVLGVLGPVRLGGRLHHTGPFTPAAVADALTVDTTDGSRSGPAVLYSVPTLYSRLADALDDPSDPALADRLAGALGAARLLVSGSAGLPAPVAARLQARTGQVVIERYGMTETAIITAVPAHRRRTGTVGPPLPGTEVKVLDDQERTVPGDGVTLGEVWVRSPSMFSGYLNRPDATRAVLDPQGWFRTGDLATVDADGWLRIVGRRSSDLINSGGFKIGAGEVEAALLDHPAVAEAAVKAMPDTDLGERVAAWVVLRPGASPTPTELESHVAHRLVAHKRPREVFLVPALPRNAMGKVIKADLSPPGATVDRR